MGAAVAADNDNAISKVIPPSLTGDKDAYVGASVAFKGAYVDPFPDGARESTKASTLLLPQCRRRAARRRRAFHCRHRR